MLLPSVGGISISQNAKIYLSKYFGWKYQQHGLEVLEHSNYSGALEYYFIYCYHFVCCTVQSNTPQSLGATYIHSSGHHCSAVSNPLYTFTTNSRATSSL